MKHTARLTLIAAVAVLVFAERAIQKDIKARRALRLKEEEKAADKFALKQTQELWKTGHYDDLNVDTPDEVLAVIQTDFEFFRIAHRLRL